MKIPCLLTLFPITEVQTQDLLFLPSKAHCAYPSFAISVPALPFQQLSTSLNSIHSSLLLILRSRKQHFRGNSYLLLFMAPLPWELGKIGASWVVFPVLFPKHLASLLLYSPNLFLKSSFIILSFFGESLKLSLSYSFYASLSPFVFGLLELCFTCDRLPFGVMPVSDHPPAEH